MKNNIYYLLYKNNSSVKLAFNHLFSSHFFYFSTFFYSFFFYSFFKSVAFVFFFTDILNYSTYCKNWFVRSLFLKKKTNIAELNFSHFLQFFFRSIDSQSNHATSNTVDLLTEDLKQKSVIVELKKSFFMTIRNNRKLVGHYLFKKFRRARYVTKDFFFFKRAKINLFNFIDLFTILQKSQLVFTMHDALFLLKNKFINVNHKAVTVSSLYFSIKPGDFVSILLNKNFFLSFFFFF